MRKAIPFIGHIRIAAIVVAAAITCTSQTQPTVKLTPEQWQQDLRFMAEHIVRQHPNAYKRTKKEVFDAAVKRLHDSIPELNHEQRVVGFMKIAALIQDGHTWIFPNGLFQSPAFPVQMYLFEDGLYIRSASPKHAALVGSRVTRIGEVDATEALRRVYEVVGAENDMGRMDAAPRMLALPLILAGTKISSDPTKLKLVVESKGAPTAVELEPEATAPQLLRPPAEWRDAGRTATATPLYLRNNSETYWFDYDRERQIVYVQHNQIANKPDEPVAQFYKRVLDIVAQNPVEKLVIDLRNNGGGNNGLNRAVVLGLIKSRMDERGKLFVITGRSTFSAAQNLVSDLENLTNAIFVGEPTAGHPNHYGDARPVDLPNSKLRLRVSTVHWQDVEPRDNRPWTAPEMATPLSFSDYAAGVDPAMKAILEYKPGYLIRDLIRSAIAEKDVVPIIAQIEKAARDARNKYVNVEADINRLGYDLINRKRTAEAVEIFKFNARMFPASANVHDSLGDGLQAIGDKDAAISSYRKALSIDPNYPSSLESLRRLGVQ